jgi:hypothetical protein
MRGGGDCDVICKLCSQYFLMLRTALNFGLILIFKILFADLPFVDFSPLCVCDMHRHIIQPPFIIVLYCKEKIIIPFAIVFYNLAVNKE